MKYKVLGTTGVKVSVLAMGTNNLGGDADEATSAEMFKTCRDAGINFIDCADSYGAGGRSEEILGRLIASCRREVVITTKCYFPQGKDVNARGGSRRHVMTACEDSLRRLKTDCIDVYFLHKFDDESALEEPLRALEDLARQGKMLYAAASNFAAWQVAKALGIQALRGWSPIQCIQPLYNLVKRQAEVELLPMAGAEKIGVMTYSPTASGLLTGKYAGGQRPAKARFLTSALAQQRYAGDEARHAADRLAAIAREHGYHPAALAVAWVGAHPALTSVILGARNAEQLRDSIPAAEITLTPELYAQLSALMPPPSVATGRDEERAG
ncbi:MAG: aldo/keto reductase [Candidatus Lambdaproteobacteria bacterium]|nr:aldo/keto reductase [Candidatus Lambdaproteobacteria bacterium]